ncbi:GNAT family N-acetyltransferase [Curtobacterium sp. MCBD17_034]|nr:GNAT family N-acetyltransferase [Curtobacterium sp. MCBD17_019]PZF60097.1 GNAT family N-acetyltransferase [Curtobacterium sp. MCBD17_034]PZM34782.1 GNAT family N-acetyltransferase [Curtobacterium sp. MCBD17_031]
MRRRRSRTSCSCAACRSDALGLVPGGRAGRADAPGGPVAASVSTLPNRAHGTRRSPVPYLKPEPWSFTIAPEPYDAESAIRLRAAARIELNSVNAGPDLGPELTADEVPVHLLARDSAGVPIGCAGLTPVQDGVHEVRKLYVRSDARSLGVADALLEHLIAAGRELGAPALVMETGSQATQTVRFLERSGFSRIAPFGRYADNPSSVCFARVL